MSISVLEQRTVVEISETAIRVVEVAIPGPPGADGSGGNGEGVTAHGDLTGLDADDHTQYHNNTRGDARYYQKGTVDTALAAKLDKNSNITGATKTKITYDAKGLVTSGADATTADIADSANKRYVTDTDLVKLGVTTGTNTGDQTAGTVAVTPSGNLASTTVQAALQEHQTDIDTINSSLGGLTDAVVLKGLWDASAGTFPGSGAAKAGWTYIVSVAGTVGGVAFNVDDRLLAIAANASTTVFASNWHKLDYTDQVLQVNGKTGNVVLTTTDIAEGTNLYHTAARVIASALTGFASSAGAVSQTDTILQAINKIVGNIAAIIGLSDGNKGDVTVASSGASWTINDAAVAQSKLAGILSDKINTASVFASPLCGGVVSGLYYDGSVGGLTTATLAGAANRMEGHPFVSPVDFTIDRIGIQIVTGVASATAKIVIYNSGTDGWPSTVAWEGTSDLDCSTSTSFSEEALNFTFVGGKKYWLFVRHSSTATLRCIPTSNAGNLGLNSNTAASYYTGLRRTLSYATPATNPFAFTSADLVAATPYSIRMRKS